MWFGAHAGVGKVIAPVALALLCISFAGPTHGQSGTPGATPPASSSTGTSGADIRTGIPSIDPYSEEPPSLRVMRQNARRDDLKKHMEQNATRLLLLTAELRADLLTREPTEADGKRLDEIARLAHAVREQMKQ